MCLVNTAARGPASVFNQQSEEAFGERGHFDPHVCTFGGKV